MTLLEDVKIEVSPRDMSPAKKRQRTDSAGSSPGIIPEGFVESVRGLTLVLEVLERQNLEQHVPIIVPLLGALDDLITAESDTRTSFNYPKQLVLSCLITIVHGLNVYNTMSLLICRIQHLSRQTCSESIH